MKKIFTLFACCLCIASFGQIIAPDTVCAGTPVNLSTPYNGVTYLWNFDTVSVDQPVLNFTSFYTGGITVPGDASINNDGGHYYIFVTQYSSQHLIRLDYGSSIHNTPTYTDLGTFGLTAGSSLGIDIEKDSATGNWYGISLDGNQILVLSFGTSLGATPTAIIRTFSSGLYWPHIVKIKRISGNWYAFITDRSGNIGRYDFGSSLTNVPIQNIIPNVGGCVNPVDFTFYQESGNWYMLITDLINANVTRYDFGINILNLTPTGVNLGNPGGFLNLPRNINLLHDCEGHLIAYIGNEGGHFTKLDFGSSITNTPSATDLGLTPAIRCASKPFTFNDTFFYLLIDPASNKLWLLNTFYFTSPVYLSYYNPTAVHTFTATGIYHISLFCDQSDRGNGPVFCKDIVVTNGTGTTSSRDTAVCVSPPVTLYADTIGRYLWNTGDTTSSIAAYGTGTYWSSVTTGLCRYRVDTTHVTFISGLSFSLGNDTALCPGGQITLAPLIPAGVPYVWSTGATTRTITIDSPGTYWLTLGSDGCLNADTINITENPDPVVNIGPDQSACDGTPVTLQSSVSYASPSYLWSTGSTAPSVSVSTSGSYWLHVTVKGCTGADTVMVDFKPVPDMNLGNDTTICPGNRLKLEAQEPSGVQYLWNTGSTDSSITISDGGLYTLTVKLNGCSATDSITITEGTLDTVNLGPDTTACIGEAVQLSISSNAAVWSNDHEGSSISVSSPGTYWVNVREQCGLVSDTINVDFHICDIGFPSAFTPNGDGKNEVIGVVGTLKYYSNFSLSIYNRWGQRVFYTEDIYSGWDGTLNGTKQDMGTYFYMIDYTIEGKKHMMKGDFQLIR